MSKVNNLRVRVILVRSRAYYRHQRKRAIAKKMKMVKVGKWWVANGKEGKLSKGKTHCSCGMCAFSGWNKNDQAKLQSMKEEIEEFMEETD